MTLFDLLFLLLAAVAAATLVAALARALRGQRDRSLVLLRNLLAGAAAYLGVVYLATAFSRPTVLHVGDPECNDDWCLAVDGATRGEARLAVTLRIFSRARRVTQREATATDVYLLDAAGRRFDPVPAGGNIPLNVRLGPGESVTTTRIFLVPPDAHRLGLKIGRSGPPICLIVGECDAFHKGTVIEID